MNQNYSSPDRAAVTGEDDLVLVALESEKFVAFDRWMDAALDVLVARWAHKAAPNATLTRFSHRGTAK